MREVPNGYVARPAKLDDVDAMAGACAGLRVRRGRGRQAVPDGTTGLKMEQRLHSRPNRKET